MSDENEGVTSAALFHTLRYVLCQVGGRSAHLERASGGGAREGGDGEGTHRARERAVCGERRQRGGVSGGEVG